MRIFNKKKEKEYFIDQLAVLLSAGMDIKKALSTIAEDIKDPTISTQINEIKDKVINGSKFWSALEASKIVPTHLVSLIHVGEESGKLPPTLIKIGEIYEEKVGITSQNLTIIIEPLLLIIIWIIVASIAIGIIMPIYNLVGSLQNI